MANTVSKASMTFGILAIFLGLAAAWGVRTYMMEEEEAPPPVVKEAKPDMLRVPLASTDLPADRMIQKHDLVELSMSKQEFEKRFPDVSFEQTLGNPRSIIDRWLQKPIKQGHPFQTTDFYLAGTSPSIASKLLPGYRAIRVEVPNTREAGVQAGMFVDVMFRANARPAKGGQPAIPEKTLTILRHIEVLDAQRPGQTATGTIKGSSLQQQKPLLFTLAVPEEKADMFGIMAGRGELWLVPTPADNSGTPDGATLEVANATTLAELLGLKPALPPSPPFETEIYERGNRSVNTFIDGRLVMYISPRQRAAMMSDNAPRPETPDLPSVPETLQTPPPTAVPQPAVEEIPTAPPAPEE